MKSFLIPQYFTDLIYTDNSIAYKTKKPEAFIITITASIKEATICFGHKYKYSYFSEFLTIEKNNTTTKRTHK